MNNVNKLIERVSGVSRTNDLEVMEKSQWRFQYGTATDRKKRNPGEKNLLPHVLLAWQLSKQVGWLILEKMSH